MGSCQQDGFHRYRRSILADAVEGDSGGNHTHCLCDIQSCCLQDRAVQVKSSDRLRLSGSCSLLHVQEIKVGGGMIFSAPDLLTISPGGGKSAYFAPESPTFLSAGGKNAYFAPE